MTTPDYLTVLFTTNSGKLILGGGLLWMSIGIFIMKQMINFDI
jgi:tight adherence protein B